jgi:wyosine [tRNA(Phe)-imidazoG37] synthetase (radical SAM superfamily)
VKIFSEFTSLPGISLQSGIIYGPILSRRLGRSLGINLLPVTHKVCSFDCVYCQYGRTDILTIDPPHNIFPGVDEVLESVAYALSKPRTINYLTFSGNGEPTPHPDFAEIVEGVKHLRDQLRPTSKIAIFSNGSRLFRKEMISAINLIDLPMMKLDAGDLLTFGKINRPVNEVGFVDILDGLRTNNKLLIQSMLIDGEISNIHGEAYELWAEKLSILKPDAVHIYSTERPTADKNIKSVSRKKLEMIQEDLAERFGLRVQAY